MVASTDAWDRLRPSRPGSSTEFVTRAELKVAEVRRRWTVWTNSLLESNGPNQIIC